MRKQEQKKTPKASIIICVVLVLLLIVSVATCGNSGDDKRPSVSSSAGKTSQDSDASVRELVTGLFTLPEETLQAKDTSDYAKMLCLINDQTVCSIKAISEESVELTITAPDMYALFSAQLDENKVVADPNAESAQMLATILSALESKDCPTVTNTVAVGIGQGDAGPELIVSEELTNAMSGNLLKLFNELYAQLGGN